MIDTLDKLRDHLRKLGNHEIEPTDTGDGVCYELVCLGWRFCLPVRDRCLQGYPGYSGHPRYPVAGGFGAYMLADEERMWGGHPTPMRGGSSAFGSPTRPLMSCLYTRREIIDD